MDDAKILALVDLLKTDDALKQKSNDEIAQLLIDHIWPAYDLGSPQSALIEAAIERLRPFALDEME